MVLDRLPRRLCSLVLGMGMVLGAIGTPGSAQVGDFTIEGSGPDPAGYRLFPPGSSATRPDRLEIEVLDVVRLEADRCPRLNENLTAPGSPAPETAELKIFVRDLKKAGKRLWVEFRGIEALKTQARADEVGFDVLKSWISEALTQTFASPDGRELLGRCLVPGSLSIIRRVAADALPRSFDQSLAARYGFSAERRHVDLVPGMRLCVDFTESVNWGDDPCGCEDEEEDGVGDESKKKRDRGKLLRAGARQCFPVGHGRPPVDGHNQLRALGFSPFFDRLTDLGVHTRTLQGARWSPGASDLSYAQSARPYYRLFYPKDLDLYAQMFPDEKATVESRPVLVGAGSPQDLELISDCHANRRLSELCQGADSCGGAGDRTVDPKVRPTCRIFQEWGLPWPEISVLLKDNWVWVPVGTTLIDLLERHGNLGLVELIRNGAADAADARARNLKLNIKRHFHGRRVKVEHSAGGAGALFLPVMQGDEIRWND